MALTGKLRWAIAAACALVLSTAAAAPAFAGDEEDFPGDPTPTNPPAGLPHPWVPRENPFTRARALLGDRLFSDKALSRDRTVSCATCHPPGNAYVDGKPRSLGIGGKVQRRNAPTLINVAYTRHPFLDGRVASLEEQAGVPILNPDEMDLTEETAVERIAADEAYGPLFEKAWGDRTVTFERIRFSIAAFQRTLLAGDSPFDEFWAGDEEAMGEDARRGFKVFMGSARCSSCHPVRQSFALFTDDQFHNTGAGEGEGLKDTGRMEVTGREADRGAFKTPTLRNVELTAPYMHDGSLATLRDVVDFYDRGGLENEHLSEEIRPLFLSERDKDDLVAFLRALTSPILPGDEDARSLLGRGEFAAARERFLRDLEKSPGARASLWGVAEASLGTAEREHLDRVAERLATAAEEDEGEERGWSLIWLGRVYGLLARQADAAADFTRAEAHREDAALAFDRAREAATYLDDAYFEGATAHGDAGRGERAEEILGALLEKNDNADGDAFRARAAVRYRLALAAARENGNAVDERSRTRFRGALEDDRAGDGLKGEAYASALRAARCLHWLGKRDEARAEYLRAVRLDPQSRDALTGLASLLSGSPEAWTAALETALEESPGHPQVLYFLGYDRYVKGDLPAARDAFSQLALGSPRDPMAHVFLARIARDGGDMDGAFDEWERALRLDPSNGHAMNDWDATLRDLPLEGWDDMARLDHETHRLVDACGVRRARILTRNNLAFRMRDAVSSYTSRGRGRMQYLVEGAPPEALAGIRRCIAIYEAAVAELPGDDEMPNLPFEERWVYAGVLNDAGLMHHYFAELQDLGRAEEHYLRAFRITEGAYMDAYFYNLQFLYGFEVEGRERRWFRLAAAARDAILKEDGQGGFEPDPRKRAAAQRDYERLRDLLGEAVADAIEQEPLP